MKLKKLLSKNWGMHLLNIFAFAAVLQNVNACCTFIHYQPEVPEIAKKLKRKND